MHTCNQPHFNNHLFYYDLGFSYSLNTSHNPLKLLSMVSLGVQLVSTMKGEYFVLAWMPHQYPKSIFGKSKSQSDMLVVAITVSSHNRESVFDGLY